ncbi:major capsid protein [Cupriavidus metallidurans]|uniref:Major capsid protein n=1 Tax=Cupriavidus metallidurans TaxID=119219 RepID=A0A482IQP9_9BURK|nr:major capsid protein [Cupriavidus metallidurans]QBP09847.1 major capsid protein [Cupriavidus metallidurans]
MNLADMFRLAELTAAINKLPLHTGLVGDMGLFDDRGIRTTQVLVEVKNGRLGLVPDTDRRGEPQPMGKEKPVRKTFRTTHLPTSGTVMPDEIQDFMAFGSDTVVRQQSQVINDELQRMKNCLELTREWQRVGAIKGQILDADGSVIYDLYDEFGVQKKSMDLAFGVATTKVRKLITDAKRHAEQKLGGVLVKGFRAICGPDFFDGLVEHPTVKEAYAHYAEAADRIGGDMRSGFKHGNVEFVEDNLQIGEKRFVDADKAHVFPITPAGSVFIGRNAPANYNETVNTLGQPFYSKAEPRKMGKGWDMEAQANPLYLNLFPEAMVTLVAK